MKQIEKNKICYYCLGCNRLEEKNFNGVIKCNYFMTGRDDWYKNYINAIKEKNKNAKKEKRV